jgi:uncharacterized protein YjbI with pentapeptide repeats
MGRKLHAHDNTFVRLYLANAPIGCLIKLFSSDTKTNEDSDVLLNGWPMSEDTLRQISQLLNSGILTTSEDIQESQLIANQRVAVWKHHIDRQNRSAEINRTTTSIHSILQNACTKASLMGANLSGLNLSHIDLRDTNLYGVDFSFARLNDSNLSGANLSAPKSGSESDQVRTNLYGANLSGADLEGANLTGVDLSGVNLKGANLDRTVGLDLTGAIR